MKKDVKLFGAVGLIVYLLMSYLKCETDISIWDDSRIEYGVFSIFCGLGVLVIKKAIYYYKNQ